MRRARWAAVAIVAAALTGCTTLPASAAMPTKGIPPYEREEFGSGWGDLDGDRCDTRQEILVRDLVDEVLDADGCKVLTGTLHDAYTGHTIEFRRGVRTSDDVQIDHIVPLAYAWHAGAYSWTDDQREAFANDPDELLAVDGPTNNAKGADGPAAWLPPSAAAWCGYASRWTALLNRYQLEAEPADAAKLDEISAGCA